MKREIVYNPQPTPALFHADDSFVRGLMGPIGSGKSVACCAEILRLANAQEPFEGVRKTRWAIIRNTYRELVDTTIQTWFDWLPKTLGIWRQQDMRWNLNRTLADGTRLQVEILFRALDRPDDIKKLLSLELTGGWINEAREVPKAVLDMLQGRVGRYPSQREGGPTWFGVLMDTNPPDTDHWFYRLFEEDTPQGFTLFRQPSGLAEEAENIANLPPNYYRNMMAGKDNEWINVYVHGNYGFVTDGKPVWPEYSDDLHVSQDSEPLGHFGGRVYVGIDFGLTPAAVIGQVIPSGQVQVIDELVTEDMGAMHFGELLRTKLATSYPDAEVEAYGDPAGEQRAQTDETTPFQILRQQGVEAWPTHTNDFRIRREVVADHLTRLTPSTHKPALVICPHRCKTLRKALAGGYKYRRLQVVGEERYQDMPLKNKYSHVADALQYMMLGAVGGDRVVGGYSSDEIDYSEMDRMIV